MSRFGINKDVCDQCLWSSEACEAEALDAQDPGLVVRVTFQLRLLQLNGIHRIP